MYTKSLPSIRTLRSLAEIDGPFPIHCRHVVIAAERFWFSDKVINFLQLFPPNEVFRSRDDFVERCKQMEVLIRQEQKAPPEMLRSPQG